MKKPRIDLKPIADDVEISDGYHTFTELYEHRHILFIALCRNLRNKPQHQTVQKSEIWRSQRHSDGNLSFGGLWFVLGIGKDKGKQITYHLPIRLWEETSFADTLEKAPDFDGHSSGDVLNRLVMI